MAAPAPDDHVRRPDPRGHARHRPSPAPRAGWRHRVHGGAQVLAGALTACALLLPGASSAATADRVPSDARAPSDLLGRPQVLADGTLAMSGGVGSVGAPPPLSPTGATLAAPAAGTDGLGASSTLAEDGIPTTALDAYRRAADGAPHSCHLDWTLIAAIGRVESDHGRFAGAVLHTNGRSTPKIIGLPLTGSGGTALIPDSDAGRIDGDAVYDHAVGPLQFIPTTWAAYGRDGDGDGKADPFDIFDAAVATARYLCAAGRDLSTTSGQVAAVLAYNHSASYVATVLELAATYAGTPPPELPTLADLPEPAQEPAAPAPPPALVVAQTQAAAPATTAGSSSGGATATTPAGTEPLATTSTTTSDPSTSSPPPSSSGSDPGSGTTTTSPTTPPTTTPPTTTPPTTTPPPTTTSTTTAPAPSCPAAGLVVAIVDGTGDGTKARKAAADLAAAGLTVGGTTPDPDATTSAIRYAAAQETGARALAGSAGASGLLQKADVEHVTVVLGGKDPSALLNDLDTLAAACG